GQRRVHQQRGLPFAPDPRQAGEPVEGALRALQPQPESPPPVRPGRFPRPASDRLDPRRGPRLGRMRKPSSVFYGVNESPPPLVASLSGLQHVGVMAVFLLYPALIAKAASASSAEAAAMVSLTLVAMAIGSIAQGIPLGPFGSGYLCSPTPSVIYLV